MRTPFVSSRLGPQAPRVFPFTMLKSKWPLSERDLWILQFLVLSSFVWFDQSDKVLLLKVRTFSIHCGYIQLWKSNDSGWLLGWEHTQMISSPTTFGLDVGPYKYLSAVFSFFFYGYKHIALFDTYLKASISFKVSFSWSFTIASKWPLVT